MSLKENLNKIHYDLKENFDEVNMTFDIDKISIDENKWSYIGIEIIRENKKIVSFVNKQDLENETFIWKYRANPNDNDSHLVERTSNIYTLLNDINDIFDKNKFDTDYINSIENNK